MWNLKNTKTSKYNKKEADTDIENKLMVTSGDRREGQYRCRGVVVQTIGLR